MTRTILAGLVLAVSPAAVTAQQAPVPAQVTLDDFYRYADVSEPAFSPDGQAIVYTVSLNVAARDAAESDLWVVPWQGGAPRQLTSTAEVSENQPRYSPDGQTLYFLSDG
jgi:Tol biopolymer transport system component